jgi:hypothetical protein
MKLRFYIASTALFAVVCGAGMALAVGKGTRDESPPAEESVCDDAGLVGAAYGLCVAYCEANDCDAFPESQACDRLFDNYSKITGATSFPCDEVPGGG